MDKRIVQRRFEAAFKHYALQAKVQQEVCQHMAAQLAALSPRPRQALEVGAGTGLLTRELVRLMPKAHWWLNDLSPKAEGYLEPMLAKTKHAFLWGDAEEVAFPHGLELVASASTVQWFEDLPRFLCKCAAHSLSGALLALSTFGPENFQEVRATTGRGLDYSSAQALAETASSSGYEVLSVSGFQTQLLFDSPAQVLRHIKATGTSGTGYFRWTAGRLREFELKYRRAFSAPGGKVALTYAPILLLARKP